jgi:hypothetical protein
MSDLQNFIKWWFKENPDSTITPYQITAEYDDYYQCSCETCSFRKEHGLPPYRITLSCTAPLSPQGLVTRLERYQ